MSELYDKALKIATIAHKGQADKAGRPYINHPVFVASLVNTEEEKVTALLHDVIEDTEFTPRMLIEQGIPENVVEAVTILTHKKGTDYFEYIESIKGNSLAKTVKIADLMHNSDISRIPHPAKKDFERIEKYKRALSILDE